MTRPIGAVPPTQCATAVFASLAIFGLMRVLFPRRSTGPLPLAILREVVLLLLTGGVLLYVLSVEQVDAAILGLRRPRLSSLAWGVAGAVLLLAVGVALTVALGAFHIRQDTRTLANLVSKPLPMILFIALTAAISEEILFRAVLIDHLGALTHSQWIGAIGSIMAFSVAHLSSWNATQLLFVIPSGTILTILFLWKRDLTACVIAHFLVDSIGLIAASASHVR